MLSSKLDNHCLRRSLVINRSTMPPGINKFSNSESKVPFLYFFFFCAFHATVLLKKTFIDFSGLIFKNDAFFHSNRFIYSAYTFYQSIYMLCRRKKNPEKSVYIISLSAHEIKIVMKNWNLDLKSIQHFRK